MKLPKDDKNYKWTSHIKNKMMYYRLSPQKIKSILTFYDRKEEGIAPKTQAVMKRNDTPKRKEEIWIMYQIQPKSAKYTMISAWRYPGKSKAGKQIPIPDEILAEIKKEWF